MIEIFAGTWRIEPKSLFMLGFSMSNNSFIHNVKIYFTAQHKD